MTLYKWSQTAASNGLADSTCPFPEGMAPSAVNDGVRGAMAAIARYRDDTTGGITTSGTSSAYALATFQQFDTLPHLAGQTIAFTPHTTNAGACTLNVDGLGAKPLRSAPGTELPAGTIIQGTPYVALYNSADGAFYLHGVVGQPYSIPIGGFLPFAASTPPNSSFVLPYGQAISRTTYATLFALVGTTYGAGDGSTTFNIPDLRGRVVAGQTNMGGVESGRLASSVTTGAPGGTGGAAEIALARNQLPNFAPKFTGTAATITVSSSKAYLGGSVLFGAVPGSGGAGNALNSGGGVWLEAVFSSGGYTPIGDVENINGNVTQQVINNIPPTIVLPYLMRVI